MKIQTKLFLIIGVLLLFVGVSMFFLSDYLIERDVRNASNKVRELLEEDYAEIESNQRTWLLQDIAHLNENVTSVLLFIYGSDELSKGLVFSNDPSEKKLWSLASRIVSYNPDIGFLEIDDKKSQKSVGILTANAHLYPTRQAHPGQTYSSFIVFSGSEGMPKETPFIGIALPSAVASSPSSYYALIDLHDATPEILERMRSLEVAEVHKNKTIPSFAFKENALRSEAKWAETIVMMQTLVPLYSGGMIIVSKNEKQEIIPSGLARVDENGQGIAILSREVFRSAPLFDADRFYSTHPPSHIPPPLASGSALFKDASSSKIILANTLSLENTYVTIGAAVGEFARSLAAAVDRPVLLQLDEHSWIGYEATGKRIPQNLLPTSSPSDTDRGEMTLGGVTYSYFRLTSPETGSLVFYVLSSHHHEQSILATLAQLNQNLPATISLQLFVVFLVSLGIALVLLGKLSSGLTRPIRQLAAATREVVAGKYTEVILPEMGTRKDEVAVLIHSFGDMVKGLEDREKIRGVLNKVVSKDVADEILKEGVHLGGEDRVVTILFSDIRGFTKMTAHLPPQETIGMLNQCMTKMAQVIEGEGGVIDKFVGDEIMALYGAPTSHPDHAIRALASSKLMIETLRKWNEQRSKEGLPPIEMGIGIHTGLVVAGNMGAEDRLNYTVLGSNVNLAARLCQVAGPMQIIISEDTLRQPKVESLFHVRALAPITLKGFDEPVNIFEVVGFKWDEA